MTKNLHYSISNKVYRLVYQAVKSGDMSLTVHVQLIDQTVEFVLYDTFSQLFEP